MTLEIDRAEAGCHVDRDGTNNSLGANNQGFNITFSNGLTIHFQDEDDAIEMARKIAFRLGHDLEPHH